MSSILPIRIQELRKLNNLSRQQLAEKLFLSYDTIKKYELSDRTPDINTLIKIADFFEVSTDYLLGRDDYLPEKYATLMKMNLLDIEMIYQSCKKITDMIDSCRK